MSNFKFNDKINVLRDPDPVDGYAGDIMDLEGTITNIEYAN